LWVLAVKEDLIVLKIQEEIVVEEGLVAIEQVLVLL
jgi:hypothetical protein